MASLGTPPAGVHLFPLEGTLPSPAALFDQLDPLLDDGDVRVVVFDLRATKSAGAWDDVACRDLRLWRKPTVCAFDATLEGGALAFALACDLRAMGEGAAMRFRPAFPAPALLASLAGSRRASTLAGGVVLYAEECRAEGLVTAVEAVALPAAMRAAGVIASRGPLATQLAKEAIWRGLDLPLEQALRFETDLTLLLQTTKDRAEGVAAFLEKREPHFRGE